MSMDETWVRFPVAPSLQGLDGGDLTGKDSNFNPASVSHRHGLQSYAQHRCQMIRFIKHLKLVDVGSNPTLPSGR